MRIPSLRPLAGAFSLCALTACSGGDANSSQKQAGTVVVPATQTTTAVAGPVQVEDTAAGTNSFATFDFANGTRFPAKATLSIGAAVFNPGASVAYVPVTLNQPTPNTVIARVITVNGSDANKAISGYQYKTTEDVVIFRPGDPLRQTVSVPILDAADGQQFSLKLREAPWGANQGTATNTVTADADATPTAAATWGFRNPRTFRTYGTLQYEMTKDTMRWSDAGWSGAWSTKLSHGRAQPANGETGLYLDEELYPWVEAPLRYTDEGLVFHTQKLWSPITYNGTAYNYGSVVLSGHNTPATQIGYGQYEWVAKMPTRRGSCRRGRHRLAVGTAHRRQARSRAAVDRRHHGHRCRRAGVALGRDGGPCRRLRDERRPARLAAGRSDAHRRNQGAGDEGGRVRH